LETTKSSVIFQRFLLYAIFNPMFGESNYGMQRRRTEREHIRNMKKGYYHMSTDGWQEGLLFHTTAQFAYGMTLIGLLLLFFDVKVYSFTLMPNHIHVLLSGTGGACLDAFDYLKNKLSAKLVKDGYPPLPEDYWFQLVAVETPEQMMNNYIYIDRNAYEKGISLPCCYPWCSSYLQHSALGPMITGRRADTMKASELIRLTGTRASIPGHWQFHPVLGLLPSSFIDDRLFKKLFKSPKEYGVRLMKDYEAFAKVAKSLNETCEFSIEESRDLLRQLLQTHFSGKQQSQLSNDERGRLAVILVTKYNMDISTTAPTLGLSEHIVSQFLRAKDYGKQR